MIYDAVEDVASILAANFSTDLAALATAHSVTVDSTVTVKKRQGVENLVARGTLLPCLGVVGADASTQAVFQGTRDATVTITCDYYATGTDADVLAAQADLVAEAILLTVDRLWPTIGVGAGEADRSIAISLTGAFEPPDENTFSRRVTVTFPVIVRDDV